LVTKNVIHVVEDDGPMRDSIVELLEDAGYAVRAYARAEELLVRGAALEAGCIVTDVRMPGIDGLALLRRLRASGSPWPLILITGHGDVSMAVRAMKAGAADFLEKPFEAEALLTSIDDALRNPSGENHARDAETVHQLLLKLTPREHEVFDYLVTGHSNKEIAARIGISPRTVEFHRAHIMEKTAAKGLPDLVRLSLVGRGSKSAK
jgi:two-component system, LuxR family, response regulator FixJ